MFQFRDATEADATLLAWWNRELVHDEGSRNVLSLEQLEARMLGLLREGYRATLVLSGSEPVGYALHRLSVDAYEARIHEAHIRQLYVLPGCRGRGAARALLNALKAAWPAGTRVQVEVLQTNRLGLRFWQKAAFVPYATTLRSVDPCHVRPAEPRDALALARLHRHSWEVAFAQGTMPALPLSPIDPQRAQATWQGRLMRGSERTWVVERNADIVGFLRAGGTRDGQDGEHDAKTAEVYAMHVSPESLSSGVGKALMRTALQGLEHAGYARVTLWVVVNNGRARGFYAHFGFEPDGTTRARALADASIDELRMARVLRSGPQAAAAGEARMGACHCGAVRFRVRAQLSDATVCNCSICTMKGFVHWFVPASALTLETSWDDLGTYTFGTHQAKHHFCKRCGISAFYVPRSHPDGYSVNLRCVADVDLASIPTRTFDGRDWESAIAALGDPARTGA